MKLKQLLRRVGLFLDELEVNGTRYRQRRDETLEDFAGRINERELEPGVYVHPTLDVVCFRSRYASAMVSMFLKAPVEIDIQRGSQCTVTDPEACEKLQNWKSSIKPRGFAGKDVPEGDWVCPECGRPTPGRRP